MRSLSSLIHSALFPSTRVYHDANGNYRGSITDVTPWLVFLGRGWGIMVWLCVILTPLLAPVYYILPIGIVVNMILSLPKQIRKAG